MRRGLQIDPLFVGCTRPPMIGGIPDTAAVGIVALAMTIVIAGFLFWAPAIGASLWGLARIVVAFDPHQFSLIGGWLITKRVPGNLQHWSSVSRSPSTSGRIPYGSRNATMP